MNTRVPKEFIKSLQGKDFVLMAGLLELAHQDGLNFTHTEILQFPNQENGNTTVVRAIVRTGKGEFSGIGDASPASVPNKSIAVHSIRMAETRALARALRVATNVAMTAFEELGGDVEAPKAQAPAPAAQAPTAPLASEALKNEVMFAAKAAGLDGAGLQPILKNRGMTWNRLTQPQAEALLRHLKDLGDERKRNLAISAEFEASRGGAV